MTAYEKLKVMKVANWMVEQLLDCDDTDFVDRVLAAVGNGELIDQDEMEYLTMAQLIKDGDGKWRGETC